MQETISPGKYRRSVPYLIEIVALFVLARVLGEVCERVKVPALTGEIAAGLVLGPLVLNLIAPSDALKLVADLGVFFIVYAAGMEMTFRGVRRIIKESGAAVAAGSFVLPFLLGFHVGIVFDYSLQVSLFLGLALSLTALPVSVKILTDLKWLNTDVGLTIVTAGLLCDIAGLSILAAITGLAGPSGFDAWDTAIVVLKIILFFMVIVTVERLLWIKDKALSKRLIAGSQKLLSKGATFSMPLIFVFLFSLLAEVLGMHFVIGTFFGSIIIAEHLFPKREGEKLREAISYVSHGFLSPIFFGYLGLVAVAWELSLAPFFIILLIAGVSGKIAGGYAGARFGGFGSWSATVIAVGMNGRGAMELVIALVGLEMGIITSGVFSSLVLLGLVTTLMTAIMLRRMARVKESTRFIMPASQEPRV